MVSVKDAHPFFSPLTAIITSPTGGYNWASYGKSCQNTIKFQTMVRENREKGHNHIAGFPFPK